LIADQPLILIWDEFPYAVESDPSLPSHLQAAWDHLLKDKPLILVLAGSHIGMMVDLLNYQAPLYGRTTGQFPVEPLPYAALADFFPGYPAAERVATYATLGGVPAYLERFDAQQSLSANIRQHLFQLLPPSHPPGDGRPPAAATTCATPSCASISASSSPTWRWLSKN